MSEPTKFIASKLAILINHLKPHLPGSAGDDAEASFCVARVQVFALGVHDVHDLFARDLADFGLVRLLRTCGDVGCFLEQNGGWRDLCDERVRLCLKNSNDDRENVAGLFLCRGIKFFTERHDVHAARTESSAHWRRGVSLSCGNLEFDVCYDFFGHCLCSLNPELPRLRSE